MTSLKKHKQNILALGVLSLIIYIYLMQFLGFDLSKIFGDLGDGRLNNYFLEHGYQYLLGNHPSFWSAPFYFPAENVMTYSDNHLGTLPFYSLFRLFGYNIETSYQLWMISIFLLNGISAFIVLRLFKFNSLGSIIGALFFSLAAPVILKTNHIQLMPRFMIPILFYAAVKFIESLDIKYFYIFCFAFVYQFYIGIYIGFFSLISLIFVLPFIVIYILNNHKLKHIINLKYFIHLVFVSVVSILLLLFLFEPYLSFKEVVGGRSWGEIASMLPRIESWFYTSGGFFDIFNQFGKNIPMQHEHYMFIGLIPYIAFIIILFSIGLKRSVFLENTQKKIINASVALVLLTFIFTLYVGGFSIYKYTFYQIPGFDAIRAVSRVVLFLLFPMAVLLAFMITNITNSRLKIFTKIIILFLIIVIGSFEQYRTNISVYDKKDAQNRYMSLYEKIKNTKDYDVIYLLRTKPNSGFFMDELDAMFLALAVNKPTINGYSGNFPLRYNLWDNNDYIAWLEHKESLFNKKVLILKNNTIEIINLEVRNEKNNQ